MFTYLLISSTIDSLIDLHVNVLVNVVSTYIRPLWLSQAPLYENRIQSNNNQENDNGIETRIREIRGPRYVVLLTLLALNSSLSFHSPRSSVMNCFQTLPDKENELRSYYLISGNERK